MLSHVSELRHGRYQNVHITPTRSVEGPRPPLSLIGGLANPEAYPDFVRHHRAGRPVDLRNDRFSPTPIKLKGHYVFGGLLMHHFGHFMAECLHRLWVKDMNAYRNWPVLFVGDPSETQSDRYVAEVMAHFEIPNYRIVREDSIVETLVIGEAGKHFQAPFHPAYIDWLRRRVQLERFIDPSFPKKLCVLRSHLNREKLIGEDVIESWLLQDGYHALRPETLSFTEQVKYYVNAERIIFSEGSAIHMLDILPPIKAVVAVLQRRPGSLLSATSLPGKVGALHVFNSAVQVFAGRNGTGYSFAPLSEIAAFLKGTSFLSEDVPPYSYDEGTYRNSLRIFSRRYLHPDGGNGLSAAALSDRMTEDLLLAYREKVMELRKERAIMNTLRAHYAFRRRDFATAYDYVKQAQRQSPDNEETASLLQKIEAAMQRRTGLTEKVMSLLMHLIFRDSLS